MEETVWKSIEKKLCPKFMHIYQILPKKKKKNKFYLCNKNEQPFFWIPFNAFSIDLYVLTFKNYESLLQFQFYNKNFNLNINNKTYLRLDLRANSVNFQ